MLLSVVTHNHFCCYLELVISNFMHVKLRKRESLCQRTEAWTMVPNQAYGCWDAIA